MTRYRPPKKDHDLPNSNPADNQSLKKPNLPLTPNDNNQDLRDLIQGAEPLVFGNKPIGTNSLEQGEHNTLAPPQSQFLGLWSQHQGNSLPVRPYGTTPSKLWSNDNKMNLSTQSIPKGERRQQANKQFFGPGDYSGMSNVGPGPNDNTNLRNQGYPPNQPYYQQQHTQYQFLPQQHQQQQQTQWYPPQNPQPTSFYQGPGGDVAWNNAPPNDTRFAPTPQQFFPVQNTMPSNLNQYMQTSDSYPTVGFGSHYANIYGNQPPSVGPLLLPQNPGPYQQQFPRASNPEFYHFEPPSGRNTPLEKLLEQHLQLMYDANFTPAMDLQLSSRYGPYDTCTTFVNGRKSHGSQRSSGVSSLSMKTASTSVSPPNGDKNVQPQEAKTPAKEEEKTELA